MKKRDHGWDAMQVRSFAKEFANSYRQSMWAIAPELREALLTHWVALRISGNHQPVPLEDVWALRADVANRLVEHHKIALETTTDAPQTDRECHD